jgi:cytochrome P450
MTTSRGILEVALDERFGPVTTTTEAVYWESWRGVGSVARIDPVTARAGYCITRRDDILAALRDPEIFALRRHTFASTASGKRIRHLPQSCEPSEHERFARVLHPLFSPRALAPYEPILRAQATALVDGIAPKGACEATVAVGEQYPCQALLTVLGLPPDDKTLGLMKAVLTGDEYPLIEHLLTQAHQMANALAGSRPLPGILWRMFDRLEDGSLTEDELLGVLLSIFLAGTETVSSTIWFALLHLARDAQLRATLRAKPEDIPAFVEEIIRLAAPVPEVPRITTEEVTIDGVAIPAGSTVWLCLRTAGREDGGDEIAIRRQRHWVFGAGPHRCLGATLTRIEVKVLICEWLNRIPDFELEPGFKPEIRHWGGGITTLGALPLRWP